MRILNLNLQSNLRDFSEWINEEASSNELQDLQRLLDLHLIDLGEYIKGAIYVSRKERIPFSTIFTELDTPLPTTPYFDIKTADYADEENLNWTQQWLEDWRGTHAERVIFAQGKIAEDWFDLDLVISTGYFVHFTHNSNTSHGDEDSSIEVGGRRYYLSSTKTEEIIDQFYNRSLPEWHDATTEFQAILSALVDLFFILK